MKSTTLAAPVNAPALGLGKPATGGGVGKSLFPTLLQCMNVSEARQLYLRELPTIDGIVRAACRRRGAGMDEEDFASL
ncbi:MAG TPA: hypothetical protein VGF40_06660, partial [Thermoanaerobaculia bacterium]